MNSLIWYTTILLKNKLLGSSVNTVFFVWLSLSTPSVCQHMSAVTVSITKWFVVKTLVGRGVPVSWGTPVAVVT